MVGDRAMHAYYERGEELDRLDTPIGRVELARTKEIVARHLPAPPCAVADIGGGPGRYAAWLAELGYRVHHRDVVPLHVDQARIALDGFDLADTAVADATDLDLDDESVDAMLLLGPLYHLPARVDRIRALGEARRVVRRGGVVFAAAISRWAARLHSVLADRAYRELPGVLEDHLDDLERTGRVPPLHDAAFTGFTHRPRQLRAEIRDAGLLLDELVGVEGPAVLLPDLGQRLADPTDAAVVLECARALERVPELLGLGPHLLAVAHRPA